MQSGNTTLEIPYNIYIYIYMYGALMEKHLYMVDSKPQTEKDELEALELRRKHHL